MATDARAGRGRLGPGPTRPSSPGATGGPSTLRVLRRRAQACIAGDSDRCWLELGLSLSHSDRSPRAGPGDHDSESVGRGGCVTVAVHQRIEKRHLPGECSWQRFSAHAGSRPGPLDPGQRPGPGGHYDRPTNGKPRGARRHGSAPPATREPEPGPGVSPAGIALRARALVGPRRPGYEGRAREAGRWGSGGVTGHPARATPRRGACTSRPPPPRHAA